MTNLVLLKMNKTLSSVPLAAYTPENREGVVSPVELGEGGGNDKQRVLAGQTTTQEVSMSTGLQANLF